MKNPRAAQALQGSLITYWQPMFRMKMMLAAMVVSLLGVQDSQATLFFTDQFNYPDNSNLGTNSPCPWNTVTAGTGDNTTQIKVTTASAQTSPPGFATSAFNGVVVAPAASNKKNAALFNGVTGVPATAGNVVYASFLLNVQTLPSANMRVVYMHNGSSSSGTMEVIVSSTGQVGIQKKGNASSLVFASGTPVASPGTHLVVIRYTFVTGSSNDELALWVDPSSLGGSAPVGYTTANTSVASDMSNPFTTIVIDSPNLAAGPVFWIDEVRVGDTWADVTPATGSCDTAGVTAGPTNITVEVGASANFSVSATGTSRTYQWQVSTDSGSNWNNTSTGSGSTTAAYNTGATTTGENGNQYRCIVNVACDSSSVTSSVATLTVNCSTAGISSHPANAGVNAGQTANFSVVATGSSPTYQWEYSPDSGANWFPVSTGTGATTASYTTAAVTAGENGYLYRCVVSVACDSSSLASLPATLTVNCDTANVTSHPTSGAVPEGLTATFKVTATGSSPTYQWEISTDNGGNWAPVATGTGGTSSNYTTAATTLADSGNQYRCVVSVACDASSDTSSAATLTVISATGTSFRSATSGRWQDAATWDLSGDNGASWFPSGITPTAANSTNILIKSGTTVVNQGSVTADQIVVEAGGTLNVSNTLTVALGSTTDLDVSGTLVVIGGSSALTIQSGVAMVVESGGVFAHDGTSSGGVNNSGTITVASGGKFQIRRSGGTIPALTWSPGSICEVAYSTASSSRPGGLGQDFQNFVWDNPLQSGGIDLAGNLTNVNGNFILLNSAGQEVKWNGNANIGGDLIISNGLFNISGSTTPRVWTLKGNLVIASGTTFHLSAGTGATYEFILNGASPQSYTCDGLNTATKLSWTVAPGSTLNLNSDLPMTASGRTLTADGTVNLNGKILSTDLLAGSGIVRNQGGGGGLLVLGAGGASSSLGTAPSLVNGATGTLGLSKSGAGTLTITDAQSFSGTTVVSNGTLLVNNVTGSGTGAGSVTVAGGTLGGTGIISGSVTVESLGNLAPGASLGDLTINGSLTLGGNITAEVNTGAAPNTDRVLGTSAVNYSGTLQVVNQGGALSAPDTFQIFPVGTRSGAFTFLPANPDNNPALAWDTSTLTSDGTLRISNVGSGPDTTPTNLVSSVSAGTLTLSWPSGHTGWTLQTQTNTRSVGLNPASNAWFDVAGSTTTNQMAFPISPANPTVFFRLFYHIP